MALLQSFDMHTSPIHDPDFHNMDFFAHPITNSFGMDDEDSFQIHQGRVTPDLPLLSSTSSYISTGDLEPVPIGAVFRSSYHQAAQQSLLKESIEFLFGSSSSSFSKQDKDGSMSMMNKNNKRKRKRSDPDDLSDDDSLRPSELDHDRFTPYQNQQWDERLEDLKDFRSIHGHCSVPYDYTSDPTLVRWVKRQRYQYKLYNEGQRSAMTEERIQALEAVGFVWDTHKAVWERRMSELRSFQEMHGHVNVPATYRANKKLAAWVKSQRRQYKLFAEGLASTLTQDRVDALNLMSFQWKFKQ